MLLEQYQAGEVIQGSPVPRIFTAFSVCSSMAAFPYVGAGVEETPKNLTVNNSVFPTLCFTRNKPWLEHNNAEVSAVNRLQCCIHSWMSQQHLDSRKTQHLLGSQQRAVLLIKQLCLLKALCVLAQQGFITSAQQSQQGGEN